MTRAWAMWLLLATLATLATLMQPAVAAGQPAQIVVPPDRNAMQTRSELRQLFFNYPPSLGQVLRLDPSLLTNESYLEPYPQLAAFLKQHPEVARDPAYFLADLPGPPDERPSGNPSLRFLEEFLQAVAIVTVLMTLIITFAWGVKTAIEHRRWVRLSRVQFDVHSKLMDRMTSNEDLLAYIQSPPGRNFLESAPIPLNAGTRPIGAPVGRILWSLQVGAVLTCIGLGLWVSTRAVVAEVGEVFWVMGILAVALGLGFVVSAVLAYLVSKHMGLLEQPATPHA